MCMSRDKIQMILHFRLPGYDQERNLNSFHTSKKTTPFLHIKAKIDNTQKNSKCR